LNLAERVQQTEFLGREFLTWLWFRSESREGTFDLEGVGTVELWFEGKMTLEADGEERGDKVTCTGGTRLREARFALTKGKKVTQAAVRLIKGDDEWTFVLDAPWLNLSGLKTPRVMQDEAEDADGLFYERMFLIEQPIAAVNALFSAYVRLRVSEEWEQEEMPQLREWIQKGA
jgi:recombination associated protein RdgC